MDLASGMLFHSSKLGSLLLLSPSTVSEQTRSCHQGIVWSTVLNSTSTHFLTKNFTISCCDTIYNYCLSNAIFPVRRYTNTCSPLKLQCTDLRGTCYEGMPQQLQDDASGFVGGITSAFELWPLSATFTDRSSFWPCLATFGHFC